MNPQVGGDILGLITCGMYETPLAALREYIQNAADAYASIGVSDGKVEVHVDPANMSFTVTDQGPGMTAPEALRALLPIARSEKAMERDRGFRGIGRLSGLAFAECVTFVTRAKGDREATSVTWHGAEFKRSIAQGKAAPEVIEQSVTCSSIEAEDRPESFFEVKVTGVARHAASQILNRDKVRQYVSEVCPVPFGEASSYGDDIRRLIAARERFCELQIYLNADAKRVTRCFSDSFKVSEAREDTCGRLEVLDIPSIDGSRSAAVGWIAHSSYFGAIHKTAGIRGIRVRVGNIQIGSESSFDPLFEEERFNRWCIGEVHILDRRIIPNARRDYFEPNPHLRNLESKLAVHLKKLSVHCRKASLARNRNKKLASELIRLRESHDLLSSSYLTRDLALEICSKATNEIARLKKSYESGLQVIPESLSELRAVEQEFLVLQKDLEAPQDTGTVDRQFHHLHPVFCTLARHVSSHSQAKQLIEAILRESSEA